MNAAPCSCRLIAIAAVAFLLAACGEPKVPAYQGYVEGEYVLVASPYAGSLLALNVARGQTIESGAALFTLEQGNEAAQMHEADEKLRASQAKLDNMRKGQRAPELDALVAEAQQAQAALKLSEAQYTRNKELFDSGFISSAGLDEAKANLARDRARAGQAQAQIRVAQQSVGRSGELAGAQAEIDAAKAVVAQADWKLAQKAQRAPQAGLVQDTFFVQGEWVPAGKPVVSLLPPANIKVRFFVPEGEFDALTAGEQVRVAITGHPDLAAHVSYLSPQPEFTPPVLYNRENRSKLVFMVEAVFDSAAARDLHPGQPVDVTPVK